MLIQRKIPQNIQYSWLEAEGFRFKRFQQFNYSDALLTQQNKIQNKPATSATLI